MEQKKNIFERNPKKILVLFGFLFFLLALFILELFASNLFGLGKVILYESHPIFGYRPVPNQTVSRDNGKTNIKINNLGLRANQDWSDFPSHDKKRVLFLGDSVTYGGSYIDNEQLFSHLAFKNNPKIEAANAGVNAWGILNIHELIKNMHFMPADIYITVVPEGDFYRGLTRIGGQPFWTRQPKIALEEGFQHLVYILSLKKNSELNIRKLPDDEQQKTVDLAVQALKDYDADLKQNHHQHYIFISPTLSQVAQNASNDVLIENALKQSGLTYTYIRNKIPSSLTTAQKQSLFHDVIHLSQMGHQVWADIIQKEIAD